MTTVGLSKNSGRVTEEIVGSRATASASGSPRNEAARCTEMVLYAAVRTPSVRSRTRTASAVTSGAAAGCQANADSAAQVPCNRTREIKCKWKGVSGGQSSSQAARAAAGRQANAARVPCGGMAGLRFQERIQQSFRRKVGWEELYTCLN